MFVCLFVFVFLLFSFLLKKDTWYINCQINREDLSSCHNFLIKTHCMCRGTFLQGGGMNGTCAWSTINAPIIIAPLPPHAAPGHAAICSKKANLVIINLKSIYNKAPIMINIYTWTEKRNGTPCSIQGCLKYVLLSEIRTRDLPIMKGVTLHFIVSWLPQILRSTNRQI